MAAAKGCKVFGARHMFPGLRVWEGKLWFEGDEGAPDWAPGAMWVNGMLYDGHWRGLTDEEWQAIREGGFKDAERQGLVAR